MQRELCDAIFLIGSRLCLERLPLQHGGHSRKPGWYDSCRAFLFCFGGGGRHRREELGEAMRVRQGSRALLAEERPVRQLMPTRDEQCKLCKTIFAQPQKTVS